MPQIVFKVICYDLYWQADRERQRYQYLSLVHNLIWKFKLEPLLIENGIYCVPVYAPTWSRSWTLVEYNLVNPRNVVSMPTYSMFWAWFMETAWSCSLAFRWLLAAITLVPAWLPRNWHLGNEMPIADRGHLIVLRLREWGPKERGRGTSMREGSSGWARMADEENEEGFDRPASATTDLNVFFFFLNFHQYHWSGVHEAYTGAGENVVIAFSLLLLWPPKTRTRFWYFTPTAVYYQSKSQLRVNLKLFAGFLVTLSEKLLAIDAT